MQVSDRRPAPPVARSPQVPAAGSQANPIAVPPRAPPRDKLKLLPERSGEKLMGLKQTLADELAAHRVNTERLRQLRDTKVDWLAQMKRNAEREHGYGVTNAKIQSELDDLDAHITRLEKVVTLRHETIGPLQHTVAALEGFVSWLSGPIAEFTGTLKVKRSGDLFAELHKTRARIAELRADEHTVRSAMLPSGAAKEAWARFVRELGHRGTPRLDVFLDGLTSPEWPLTSQTLVAQGLDDRQQRSVVQVTTLDTIAILAWAFGPQLVAAGDAMIDSLSDDSAALTIDERRERLDQIAAEILRCEREEELLVEQTGAPRRADANPIAILYLEPEAA